MGLIPTYCRALILLHKRVGLKGPLLTLGNQDLWASYEQLKTFFDEAECPRVEAAEVPHTSMLFRQRSEAKDFVHARTFFEMMGIRDYYDIDKFTQDSPQIQHDLNNPIPSELRGKFNLIIDGGTIEHIFDVRQVMENIVRMCRESGWVVHITPSSNYVDHGFYSFSPSFFYDFYRTNGFGEFICYIFQANAENFFEQCSYFEYSYGMDLSKLIDPQKVVVVFFAAKKISSLESLIIPTQGVYQAESQAPHEQPPAPAEVPAQQGVVYDSLAERLFPAFLLPYLKPVRFILGTTRAKITPPYRRLPKL